MGDTVFSQPRHEMNEALEILPQTPRSKRKAKVYETCTRITTVSKWGTKLTGQLDPVDHVCETLHRSDISTEFDFLPAVPLELVPMNILRPLAEGDDENQFETVISTRYSKLKRLIRTVKSTATKTVSISFCVGFCYLESSQTWALMRNLNL